MSLIIGKIVKAQGIKGEVKVIPITDNVLRFNDLKKIFIEEIDYIVDNVRISGDIVFLKLKNVNTRNDAEALQNKFISVSRENAVKLPENSWFIVDIIGSSVYVGKKLLGTLVDVLQNSKVDVYVVSGEVKEIMFPALKDLLISVDIDKKIIILDEKRFAEVAVYD